MNKPTHTKKNLSNKIIIKNPKELTENIIMDLYKKSDLPETSYFQCLAFLALRNYKEVCRKIIKDKNRTEARNPFRSSLKSKYPLFSPIKRFIPTNGVRMATTE